MQIESIHVAAARELWTGLEDFRRSDRALFALQGCFPSFDAESTLLKVLALHSVDTSRTFVGLPLARKVQDLVAHAELERCGPELVDALASCAQACGKQAHGGLSFASRFAHFFVSSERFPILDKWTERALEWCLERPLMGAPGESRYGRFARDFHWIAGRLGLSRRRELGQWAWLAGQYLAWQKSPKTPMHRAVRALFEAGAPQLAQLLPGSTPLRAPDSAAPAEPPPALPRAAPPSLEGAPEVDCDRTGYWPRPT